MTKAVLQYPLLVVFLSLNILACSGSGTSSGALPCVAGEQRACDCVGGARGVQVCRADGTAFDACTGCTAGSSSSGGTSGGSSMADAWTCSLATRGTNDGCDCGCGATDPDCDSNSCTAAGCFVNGCDYCHNAQGAVVPCGGSPSSSSAAGTSSGSVTTSTSAPSSSVGQASSSPGSSLPAVSSSAGSSSLAASGSGSSGGGASSAAGSGGSSLGGSGGSSGGPSCFECACVQLLSQGGCADVCSGQLNGTGTPNFCDGNNALSQCEACIQSVCGAPSAACGFGGTSSSGSVSLSSSGGLSGSSSSGGGGPCDPLAVPGQQGCAPGTKCTWVVLEEVPALVGQVTCVPDGTVALGDTCSRGPPGTSGFDNCVAGAVCVGASGSGVCRDICSTAGGAGGACAAGQACVRRSGLFANEGDQPVLGTCDVSCDPLTQTRLDALGQTTSCGVGQGCYLLSSAVDTIAVCAGAGTPTHNQPITGTAFANSCAPGHVPREAVQGTASRECTALCKPADVYMGNNEAYEGGDSRVVNWMGLPATCESAGGPSVLPDVPVTGESCQYYWAREPTAGITAFSNTLGYCFNHANWTYDASGMGVGPNLPYPRCINVTTGDVLPPVDLQGQGNDALYFSCVQLPITPAPPAPPAPLLPFSPLLPPAPLRMDMLGPFNR